MPQVFPRRANTIARASLLGSLLAAAGLIWVFIVFARSSYGTEEGMALVQPVPFSHQHHVGILGIDCRYCHTEVEHAAYAGMPPTKTCMNCHSQIWVGSDVLQPVRDSYATNESLRWRRVYNLPGFVYFDHHIHVQKGIGCASCHGRIDEMPFTYQVPSLLMEWCLDCHRQPEQHVRVREQVFNMQWQASDEGDESGQPYDQPTLGRKLVREYGIKDATQLTSCTVCHR
jgi:hypothetical protein